MNKIKIIKLVGVAHDKGNIMATLILIIIKVIRVNGIVIIIITYQWQQ